MVETEVMYLGPLIALSHRAPSGNEYTFYRNRWMKYDFPEEDIKFYAKVGGFKVKKVSIKKKILKPLMKETVKEEVIGG